MEVIKAITTYYYCRRKNLFCETSIVNCHIVGDEECPTEVELLVSTQENELDAYGCLKHLNKAVTDEKIKLVL